MVVSRKDLARVLGKPKPKQEKFFTCFLSRRYGLSVKLVKNYKFLHKGEINSKTTTEKLFAKKARNERIILKEVQAKKSIRRMPWHREPTKDVTNCDKLRGAVNKL